MCNTDYSELQFKGIKSHKIVMGNVLQLNQYGNKNIELNLQRRCFGGSGGKP